MLDDVVQEMYGILSYFNENTDALIDNNIKPEK
jgi:hypothetical protein